jgi:cytochrome o ubiquinol oxidase operon protein cyoD
MLALISPSVVITLSGSLWVMYHLNHNMMPTMSPETCRRNRAAVDAHGGQQTRRSPTK